MISPVEPDIRLYVDLPLANGIVLEPSAAQSHYLLVVMRRRAGDLVALFNGRDGEWLATIEAPQRRRCRLAVQHALRPQTPEPGPALLFGPLRRTRQIEAAEQCGRITVPEIVPVQPLEQRLATWPGGRRLYHADETGGGQPLLEALGAHGSGDLLIGPAGGFEPAELAALQACEDVVAVSLGPRILRAETAALAALVCWQAVCGPRPAAERRGRRQICPAAR
jgi:16S rRNA (uracil1498-N3)-methyltransferase